MSYDTPRVFNKRRKNWPSSAIYVGRPGFFGNPFEVAIHGHGIALDLYRTWIMEPEQKHIRDRAREILKHQHLLCWCAPAPCHADILLAIANSSCDEEVVLP